MTSTSQQHLRLTSLADDLARRGFGEGDEFFVMTGHQRAGVRHDSELFMLTYDARGVFQVEVHDIGQERVRLRTLDLDEAIALFVNEVVRLVRERRTLARVDVTGLPIDPKNL